MDTTITSTTGAALTALPSQSIERIANVVLDSLKSERTKRDYRRALLGREPGEKAWTPRAGQVDVLGFLPWYAQSGRNVLNKDAVNAHVAYLRASGVGVASINQRLSAIRKFALEAADNELIAEGTAQAIRRVEGTKKQGRKLGNRLTSEQAAQLINAPLVEAEALAEADRYVSEVRAQRDHAILAMLIGCGLRREEIVGLRFEQIQTVPSKQHERRWVIADIEGKHDRTRTVPMADWVKVALNGWLQASGVKSGVIFRRMLKGDKLTDKPMSAQAVWNIVESYTEPFSMKIAPHDLRRTFARLAFEGGAKLEQIQQSLGHASVKTTEAYIGAQQDMENAPSDFIELEL